MDEKEIKRTTDPRKKRSGQKAPAICRISDARSHPAARRLRAEPERTSKSGECGNFVRKGSRRR